MDNALNLSISSAMRRAHQRVIHLCFQSVHVRRAPSAIFAGPLLFNYGQRREHHQWATTVKQANKDQEDFAEKTLHPRRIAIQQSRSMHSEYDPFRNMVATAMIGDIHTNLGATHGRFLAQRM